MKASFLKDNIVPILALLLVIEAFGLLPFLIFGNYPKERENLVFTIAGMLHTSLAGVTGFYFGSSLGSSKKDDILNKQNEKANPDITTPSELSKD